MGMKFKSQHRVYRGRMTTGKKIVIFAIVLVALLVLVVGGFFVAQKYIVYTADGFHFDFPFFNSTQKKPTEPDIIEIDGDKNKPENPSEPETDKEPEPVKAQTVQAVTADITRVADPVYRTQILDAAKNAGASAVVVTVMDESGKLNIPVALGENPSTLLTQAQAQTNAAEAQIAGLKELKLAGLELIGTVSVCRNNLGARAHRDGALRTNNGSIWLDQKYIAWFDPTQQITKDYVSEIMAACRAAEFSQVILQNMEYPQKGKINLIKTDPNIDRAQAICDVISVATAFSDEMKISVVMTDAAASLVQDAAGQSAEKMAQIADYLVVYADNPALGTAVNAANPKCAVMYWLTLEQNPNDKTKNYILNLE